MVAKDPYRIHKHELLKQFLINPKQVGTIAPSSRALVRAMTDEVRALLAARQDQTESDIGSALPLVLELGAGTGIITQELLKAGLPPQNLIIVDINPVLVAKLAKIYPGVTIIHGDARNLEVILPPAFKARIDIVVSSLPLKNFNQQFLRAFIDSVFMVTRPRAILVQYSYFLTNPLRALSGAVEAQRHRIVWFNLPPAVVWHFRSRRDL